MSKPKTKPKNKPSLMPSISYLVIDPLSLCTISLFVDTIAIKSSSLLTFTSKFHVFKKYPAEFLLIAKKWSVSLDLHERPKIRPLEYETGSDGVLDKESSWFCWNSEKDCPVFRSMRYHSHRCFSWNFNLWSCWMGCFLQQLPQSSSKKEVYLRYNLYLEVQAQA